MKKLAYLFSLVFLFAALLLVGCEESDSAEDVEQEPSIEVEDEKDDNEEPADDTIIIAEEFTELIFDSETSSDDPEAEIEKVVEFIANAPWKISIDETKATDTWVTVSPMSGDAGESEITITLSSNDMSYNRTTTITIISGDTKVEILITQYAKLSANQCSVTFESNGGTSITTQYVDSGSTATEPTDPTRAGYSFAGWYSDSTLTQEWGFDTSITENITIYAKWTSTSVNGELPDMGTDSVW